MKKLYMYCSSDKYRLPLAVADSIPELAQMLGRTKNAVASGISHGWPTWAVVNISDKDYREITKRDQTMEAKD